MTSWSGPTGRAGRTLLMRLAVLVFVAPLAACDQAAEAPANAVSAPPPAVMILSLRPTGQFVGVRVERGEPKRVLALPQAAIQVDQAGPYVLVVGSDDKVEERRVRLGALEGVQVVVEDGLNEGDRVIVEGIQKVRPGMAVAVSEGPPVRPAGQPALQPPFGSTAPGRTITQARLALVWRSRDDAAPQFSVSRGSAEAQAAKPRVEAGIGEPVRSRTACREVVSSSSSRSRA
jgi:hypothetical protein